MSSIPFFKMCGCGNDFIIVDNAENNFSGEDLFTDDSLPGFIRKICRRGLSVGADGFILFEPSDEADFKWRFYNSDGSVAGFCGNGARCIARFAYLMGHAKNDMTFKTDVGIIEARVIDDRVRIKMADPKGFDPEVTVEVEGRSLSCGFIDTGVPHVVIPWENPTDEDVIEIGKKIRFHPAFSPDGANVNFVSGISENSIANRTYERGVENETLACGTGCVAAAIITSMKHNLGSPVKVKTKSGGYLQVHYKEEAGVFSDVYHEGDARVIYKGDLWQESWK